ncbi:MAG TPA: coenzyme A pyrophosphatase [Syntrophomonas sp.]|jgi:8-oxo-dGTP pyrophosphatase MutT (NUDIX family)|nr:coenzyme A pyrophosphatase [Syntrophomonas sp.]
MLEDKIRSVQGRRPKVLGHAETLKSAVIVPLITENDEIYVVFEKRAATLKWQPGEICFPGGRTEPCDKGTRASAVRETCEELGLSPDDIEIIAPLDIMVHPANCMIFPYLAFINARHQIRLNYQEVERLLFVPLSYLLEAKPQIHNVSVRMFMEEDFPFELIPQGKNYPLRIGNYWQYFYFWEGEVIWGMTSRILQHFIDLLKS